MKAYVWDGDDKDAKMDIQEIPGRPQGARRRVSRRHDRGCRRDGRRGHGGLPRGQGARRGDAAPPDPQGDRQGRLLSDDVRLGLQEQGRAAAARRRRRLPALARRSRSVQGHRPQERRAAPAQADRRGSALAARLQDHELRARRLDHLLPHLLGQDPERHGADQHHARQERARRPHVPDACRRPRRDQGSLRRRHRRAVGPQGYAHGRDAERSATSPCCSRRWTSPTPSSR